MAKKNDTTTTTDDLSINLSLRAKSLGQAEGTDDSSTDVQLYIQGVHPERAFEALMEGVANSENISAGEKKSIIDAFIDAANEF